MIKIMGLGLSLLMTAGFFGCTSIATNNANLRNTNTNTGYMTNNANVGNAAVPMATAQPMASPMTNSTMNSNMKPMMNSNMKPMNSNSKMANKP